MDELSGFMPDDDEEEDFHMRPIPCELPAAKIRREKLDSIEIEEDWICPICPLTDHSTRPENMPTSIAEFHNALSSQPRQLPELEACMVLSKLFNRTCYERDRARPAHERLGLKPINPSDVQAHLKHSQHLISEEERLLDERIWYTNEMSKHLERDSLWLGSTTTNNVKLDRCVFQDWIKVQAGLIKLIEIRQRFHGHNSSFIGGRGGIKKKRRNVSSRYPYSRSV